MKGTAPAERLCLLLLIRTGSVVDVLVLAVGWNNAVDGIPVDKVLVVVVADAHVSLAVLASRLLLQCSTASLASAAVRSGLE